MKFKLIIPDAKHVTLKGKGENPPITIKAIPYSLNCEINEFSFVLIDG